MSIDIKLMDSALDLGELKEISRGTATGRITATNPCSEFTPLGLTIPEEADIVDLTPLEVDAILLALCMVNDNKVAEGLEVDREAANLVLNSVYKKLRSG